MIYIDGTLGSIYKIHEKNWFPYSKKPLLTGHRKQVLILQGHLPSCGQRPYLVMSICLSEQPKEGADFSRKKVKTGKVQ